MMQNSWCHCQNINSSRLSNACMPLYVMRVSVCQSINIKTKMYISQFKIYRGVEIKTCWFRRVVSWPVPHHPAIWAVFLAQSLWCWTSVPDNWRLVMLSRSVWKVCVQPPLGLRQFLSYLVGYPCFPLPEYDHQTSKYVIIRELDNLFRWWTSAGLLLIKRPKTYFNEIWIKTFNLME